MTKVLCERCQIQIIINNADLHIYGLHFGRPISDEGVHALQ